MTEIVLLSPADPLWDRVADYAEGSPWRAGAYLARQMRRRDFLPWERVIAARDGEDILGCCTLTAHDEMPPDSGFSPFVGFVFVDEAHRGRRLSERMIARAAEYAASLGFSALYLMSGERGLYEKYGFTPLGDYPTVFGTVDRLFRRPLG